MEIRPIMSALLRSKTGAVLVAIQVALTLAIVANAAFVVTTRLGTMDRKSGVEEANLFQLTYVATREIEDRAGMVQKDLETLRALPGVVGATQVNQLPMTRSGWHSGLTLDRNPNNGFDAAVYLGDESLIPTLGLRVVEGRNFTANEVAEVDDRKANTDNFASSPVILTRHLAKLLFPNDPSAIGKVVYHGAGPDASELRIVGIVDTLMDPGAPNNGTAYDCFLLPVRMLENRQHYAIRTAPGQQARVMTSAEQALSALRTDRARTTKRTMGEIREARYRNERTGAGMLIAVGIGLLLVTGSGIVGVASLWVSQRRKQIGVRRALGAGRIDILRYFVTENLIITTVGVALGVVLAIGLNQFLISKLELTRLPAVYILGGVGGLWTLGILAVLGPAWRAAAVPPAIATRGV
jgi:putative ABC transport system permease protein